MAEKTKMGWFIMSPGSKCDNNTMLLTQTAQNDYEDLCRLEMLWLADTPEPDQNMVHAQFKEQFSPDYHGEAIIQSYQRTNKEVYDVCQV